jgi:hypothetical protein
MTDRELLELAAKAAGVPKRDLSDRFDCWEETPIQIHRAWSPLTNDGDALRLAVKIGITVNPPYEHDDVATASHWKSNYFQIEKAGSNPYAATRRAIVRAAAEIGKAMP